MAARLKVFLDENCTQELYRLRDGSFFFRYNDIAKGRDYIDGNEGAKRDFKLYLKNVGSRAAFHVKIFVKQKESKFLNVFTEKVYSLEKDIPVNGVEPITLGFVIAPWTEAQVNTTTLIMDYYSLPDETPELSTITDTYTLQEETDFGPRKEGPDMEYTTYEEGHIDNE